MPTITYTGSFGGVGGYGGITTTATSAAGYSVPSDAVIFGVSYSLKITANGYSSSRLWMLEELAIGDKGGVPTATGSAAMEDRDHFFTGEMRLSPNDVDDFSTDTITVYANAYSTAPEASSYLWDVLITVTYGYPEKCVEPSDVTVNGKTSTVNVPEGSALLAWSGAEAGADNVIGGYLIRYRDSADGESWGDYHDAGEVETSATSGSATVEAPSIGIRRKYSVWTVSAYGSEYNSTDAAESPIVIGGHEALEGFTDDPLTAGATPVKALHMQELQDRVATLRTFYGLSAFAFSEIIAGQTSLAGWTAHVLEIRAALDEISEDHAAWLTIAENKPRADVMQQLRDVVMLL